MRLSGGILCALCFGAHDRRFTRSRSGSGSQAKPSSAEEQAVRRAGRHPRTLRGWRPSSHRPRRNCVRRCRRRIRAADSGPSLILRSAAHLHRCVQSRCCRCAQKQSFRPQHLMGRFVGFLGADIDARIAPVWPQIVGKCAFRHIIRRQNAIYDLRIRVLRGQAGVRIFFTPFSESPHPAIGTGYRLPDLRSPARGRGYA